MNGGDEDGYTGTLSDRPANVPNPEYQAESEQPPASVPTTPLEQEDLTEDQEPLEKEEPAEDLDEDFEEDDEPEDPEHDSQADDEK